MRTDEHGEKHGAEGGRPATAGKLQAEGGYISPAISGAKSILLLDFRGVRDTNLTANTRFKV
jgi:hypothetical protein